jgi:hypothetical protein
VNPDEPDFENVENYVNSLKLIYEKLRWVPLKLNSLLHFNDYDVKQMIAEEAKHNVIIRLNSILQELLEF